MLVLLAERADTRNYTGERLHLHELQRDTVGGSRTSHHSTRNGVMCSSSTFAASINLRGCRVESKSIWTRHHARTEAFPEPRHFKTHLKQGIRAVRHSWTVCLVLPRCSSSAGSNCLEASGSMIALCSRRSGA